MNGISAPWALLKVLIAPAGRDGCAGRPGWLRRQAGMVAPAGRDGCAGRPGWLRRQAGMAAPAGRDGCAGRPGWLRRSAEAVCRPAEVVVPAGRGGCAGRPGLGGFPVFNRSEIALVALEGTKREN